MSVSGHAGRMYVCYNCLATFLSKCPALPCMSHVNKLLWRDIAGCYVLCASSSLENCSLQGNITHLASDQSVVGKYRHRTSPNTLVSGFYSGDGLFQ